MSRQRQQSTHTYHTVSAAVKNLQMHPPYLGLTFMPQTSSKCETR
jgi:hypothetical protein